jgi:hypothetical protein
MFLLLALIGCQPEAEIPEYCDLVEVCGDGSLLLDCTNGGGYYQVFWTYEVDDIDGVSRCDGGKNSEDCQLTRALNSWSCSL